MRTHFCECSYSHSPPSFTGTREYYVPLLRRSAQLSCSMGRTCAVVITVIVWPQRGGGNGIVSDVPYVNGAPRGWVVAGTLRRLPATASVSPPSNANAGDVKLVASTHIRRHPHAEHHHDRWVRSVCMVLAWQQRESTVTPDPQYAACAAPFDTVLREPMLSVPVVATMGDDETLLQQLSSWRSFASQRAQSTGAWCSRGSRNKNFTAHQQCPFLFRLH